MTNTASSASVSAALIGDSTMPKSELVYPISGGPDPLVHKVKLIGCSVMTNNELERHFNLHHLTDKDLESVGLERSSLIDDYRLMHEISLTRQMAERKPAMSEDRINGIMILQRKLGMRVHKRYSFQLLSQLVRLMDFEPEPSIIFPESQFHINANYMDTKGDQLLTPDKRMERRFDAFYEHLDNMFVNGNRSEAIDVVMDAFVRVKQRRMQISKLPIPTGYMSPRNYRLNSPRE